MILRANFLYVLFLVMIAACRDGAAQPAGTFTVSLTQGDREESVQVEVAGTPNQRQQGLMHRDHLDEDKGMLFLFLGVPFLILAVWPGGVEWPPGRTGQRSGTTRGRR